MTPTLRIAAPLALVVAFGTLAATAQTATADPAPTVAAVGSDHPELLLRGTSSGRTAIRELGDDLDAAARRNSMSSAELRKILSEDSTAAIFPDGKLAYVDARRESVTQVSPETEQALIVPEGQTFTLHSRLGSKHTIFLDFDGANVSNTLWNRGSKGIPNQTYDGFSIDGTFDSFNTAEHEYIQEVWRIISENFATFDVDVTTQDPGPSAYNRSSAADATYGDHVLFSDDPDSNPICKPDVCGGVAFVDTFAELGETGAAQDYYEPAWVRKYDRAFDAAIAATHEIGHTLGLKHDGTTSPNSEYYKGHGAWSPIMGAGSNAIQQFSNGDYKNASNKQDDLAVITATGGLPTIPDEAGDALESATTLGAKTDYTLKGLITNRADLDVYKVGPCTSGINVNASGAGIGSALDLKVDVLDGSGNTLTTQNPPSGQAGSGPPVATGVNVPTFNVPTPTSPPDFYFVKVDGTGSGNALTTGYSDYGSIGSYSLNIAGCTPSNGTVPGQPGNVSFTHTRANGTVSWTKPAGLTTISGYRISGLPGGPYEVSGTTTSTSVTVPGNRDITVSVAAFNNAGAGSPGTKNAHINSWAPTAAPSISLRTNVLSAIVAWKPGPNPGGSVLTGWRIQEGSQSDDLPVPDFRNGVTISYRDYGTHTIRITPLMYAEDGSTSPSRTVTFAIATKPSAPKIKSASSGKSGGSVSATARWSPGFNGGAAITSYKVTAYKLNSRGKVIGTKTSKSLTGSARSYAFKLSRGTYKFKVVAYTVKGASAASKASNKVKAR